VLTHLMILEEREENTMDSSEEAQTVSYLVTIFGTAGNSTRDGRSLDV
jgi:hypothetical protein